MAITSKDKNEPAAEIHVQEVVEKLMDTSIDAEKPSDDVKKEGSDSDGVKAQEQKKAVISRGLSGEVKWFSHAKRYGFIKSDDYPKELFFHASSCIVPYKNTRGRFYSIRDGDKVEFDVVQGFKGVEATTITGPNGIQIMCFFQRGSYASRRQALPSRDSPDSVDDEGADHNAEDHEPKKKVDATGKTNEASDEKVDNPRKAGRRRSNNKNRRNHGKRGPEKGSEEEDPSVKSPVTEDSHNA